jgi:hypothetical protein
MLDEIEKALRAGGAFSEMYPAGCLDNSEPNPPDENQQAQIEAHERLLEIKRTSIWDIGCLCHAQLTLMLGSLQYGDDGSTFDHCKAAVAYFRAIAKLTNDLRQTSGAGQ